MEKIKIILGITIVLFSLAGCNSSNQEKVDNINQVVKIGAVFPLTGDIAEYGNYWKQGLELAIDDATNSGLIKKDQVNLFVEDGKANPTNSLSAFTKLTSLHNIQVCFSATSGVTLALKPTANEKRIILMNASAISTEIEDKPDFLFSVIPNANYTGNYLAETAFNKLQKQKAGILYRNDASGKSFYEVFKKKFSELGGEVVYKDAHPVNNTDFKSYILKIKNVPDLDVLFVASWGPEVAHFVKDAKENNLGIQVLAYETFKSPKVLEIAGDAANGVIFSSPKLIELENQNEYLKFKKEVKEKFHHEEINYHILGHYDAMMIILNAISQGNFTSEQIKKCLEEMKEYKGETGDIKFDANGGAIVPLGLYTVKDKQFAKF